MLIIPSGPEIGQELNQEPDQMKPPEQTQYHCKSVLTPYNSF